MANLNYIHSAKILKAALPYFDYKTKPTMDLLAKLLDFMGSLCYFKAKDLAACDYEQSKQMPKGCSMPSGLMLRSRKAIVDQILGFLMPDVCLRITKIYGSHEDHGRNGRFLI